VREEIFPCSQSSEDIRIPEDSILEAYDDLYTYISEIKEMVDTLPTYTTPEFMSGLWSVNGYNYVHIIEKHSLNSDIIRSALSTLDTLRQSFISNDKANNDPINKCSADDIIYYIYIRLKEWICDTFSKVYFEEYIVSTPCTLVLPDDVDVDNCDDGWCGSSDDKSYSNDGYIYIPSGDMTDFLLLNHDEILLILIQKLDEMKSGMCPQGRTTRLMEVAHLYT